MAGKEYFLRGAGALIDIDDKEHLIHVDEVGFTIGLEGVEWSKANQGGTVFDIVGQPLSGRVSWNAMNAEILAFLTGGASAAGSWNIHEQERGTIAADIVTLSATPVAGTLRLTGKAGTAFDEVAAGPSVGEFTRSGAALTFNVGETETTVFATYLEADGAAGQTVTIGPDDLPASFEAYLVWPGKDTFGADAQAMVLHAKKLQRSGAIDLVGSKSAGVKPGFDFHIENNLEGDVEVGFGD